jgi:zinc-ribbon domain
MTDQVSGESAAMKICSSCGEPVDAAAKTCGYCGYHFDRSALSRAPWREPIGIGGVLATLAGALLVLGTFLPWVSIKVLGTTIQASGIDSGVGTCTLLLGGFALVIGISTLGGLRLPTPTGPATITAGLIAALIGIWEVARIGGRLDGFGGTFFRINRGTDLPPALNRGFALRRLLDRLIAQHVGVGLWVVIAGAAVAIVSGLFLLSAMRRPPDMAPSAADLRAPMAT